MNKVLSLVFALVLSFCGCAQSTAPTEGQLTAEQLELVESMKNADTPQIKAYITKTLEEPLDEGYELPDHIRNAKTVKEASDAIGARYPEFFGKEGSEYLQAVAAHPIKYRELIQETRAMRNHFVHPDQQH
jgi:hypothetical protein